MFYLPTSFYFERVNTQILLKKTLFSTLTRENVWSYRFVKHTVTPTRKTKDLVQVRKTKTPLSLINDMDLVLLIVSGSL